MLKRWQRGDSLAADHFNEPVDLLNKMVMQSGGVTPVALPGPQRIPKPGEGVWESYTGVIVRNGPGSPGEPETYDARTDQTYWVKIEFCNNEYNETHVNGGGDYSKVRLKDEDDVSLRFLIVLATHWAEWASGTHQLAEGTVVQIYGIGTRGNDALNGTKWFFSLQPSMWTVNVGSGISGQGGRYDGTLYVQPTNAAASGNLAASDLGGSGAACIVWNTLETGAATHLIPSGTKLTGCFVGMDTGSGKPIIEVSFAGDGDWSPMTVGLFDNNHAGSPDFTDYTNISTIRFGIDVSDTNVVGYTNWDFSGALGSIFYVEGRGWTLALTEDGYNQAVVVEKVTNFLIYNWDPGSPSTPGGAVDLLLTDEGNDGTPSYKNGKKGRLKAQLAFTLLMDVTFSVGWDLGANHTPGVEIVRTYTVGLPSTQNRFLPYEFPVDLLKTGGSAGSPTTQCSFTYTMKNRATGATIATGMSPVKPRPGKGKMIAATKGRGYVDHNGDPKLEEAYEVFLNPCNPCEDPTCTTCYTPEEMEENCPPTKNLTINKTGGGTASVTLTLSAGEWGGSVTIADVEYFIQLNCETTGIDPTETEWDIAVIAPGHYSNTHYRSATKNSCCPPSGNYPKYDSGTVPFDSIDI